MMMMRIPRIAGKITKKKKKAEKPTARKYIVYCEGCNASSQHFMTFVEVYNKTVMKQWCKSCDKMTKWAIHFKKEAKK